MKYYFLPVILFFFSCEQKTKIVSTAAVEIKKTNNTAVSERKDPLDSYSWFQYYQKENPNFKNKSSRFTESNRINYQQTPVIVLNKKGFNEIYKPFLIFNESKTQYLDFDSYQWTLLPDGSAGFEPDQQVVLVDLKKKEAQQIAFFGPSYWVEEAYWKGDSIAVLLGNSYEKIPFKMEFNFNKNQVQHYQYPDTLKIKTPYSKFRLSNKGIKVE